MNEIAPLIRRDVKLEGRTARNAEPVDTAIGTTHMCQCITECGLMTGDQIRGGHYGQRSCEPHQQAEHMAAPTYAAT